MSLLVVETTQKDKTPRLVRKGRAAKPLVHWIKVGQIEDNPLFHSVSKSGWMRKRRLNLDAIAQIVKHRLKVTGLRRIMPHRIGCVRAS
ncbi:hypothetical protein [uncultured Ruegeria sp.]|uniref:hypothetical protein n=1 Tax=uncultured Ruegeria sp. TaxID=259304 RepID=UPI00260BB5FD|nr:hypothetical protein [uncultured Ruegeria sp.]